MVGCSGFLNRPQGAPFTSALDLISLQGEDAAGCQPHLPAVQELQEQPELLAGARAQQPGAAQ